ncbi:MAG: TetR/AcrR family transcriptional regulator, partial [Ktedonobacterales bacterium]
MARRPALPGVDRREQILEAALDVFAEEGLNGATTKEIAARAGVTHGLIYFYFPSKDDLFNAAFEHQAQSD